MKKLSKKTLAERDEIVTDLSDSYEQLDTVIANYNAAMQEQWVRVLAELGRYNAKVQAAHDWIRERIEQMEKYQADRSVKWHETDAGQAYQAWVETFHQAIVDIEEVELEEPEELELTIGGPQEQTLLDLEEEVQA